MARPSSYTWEPLYAPDQIRLLILNPGIFNADVEVDIQIVDAREWRSGVRTYTALSYFCGPPVLTDRISCHGLIISVTHRLHLALQYLRLEHDPRVLWIDALCIDQSNTNERHAQILLMHDIYRNADSVLAWLGEISDEVKAATMLGSREKGVVASYPDETPVELCLKLAERVPLEALRSDFIGIFLRPWFTRTWVGGTMVFLTPFC